MLEIIVIWDVLVAVMLVMTDVHSIVEEVVVVLAADVGLGDVICCVILIDALVGVVFFIILYYSCLYYNSEK